MSQQPQDRRPDALKAPLGFARGQSSRDRLIYLKETLSPILGVEQVAVFNQGDHYFVARDAHETLLFPIGHPRHPEPRYDWCPGEQGLEFGYLVEASAGSENFRHES